MKDRIKIVRKKAGLKQAQFAKILGVKTNTITSYETGVRTPSDAIILSICRAFHVNETWLRTGEGEMLASMSREQEVEGFLDELFSSNDSMKMAIVQALARIPESGWDMIIDFVFNVAEAVKRKEGSK